MEGATIQDFRGSLMPSFIQSFKLVKDRQIAARPFLILIAGVILIGMFIGFQMNVRLGYDHGGLGLQNWMSKSGPNMVGNNINNLLTKAQEGEPVAWVWLTLGAFFTYALMLARARLAWFPLHPLGYLMSFTWPLYHLWFSIFVGWLCKSLLGKYGGPETVHRTTPLFLGLALGDVAMMLFWILIDGWQGRTGH